MALNTGPRYTYDANADAKAQAALAALKRPEGSISRTSYRAGGLGDAAFARDEAQWMDQQRQYASAKRAAKTAGYDPQAAAEQRIMDATFGRGDDILGDPRAKAALDALQGQLDPKNDIESQLFSQGADMAQAGAASQGELLRQQMARSGIGMNDPAAQAQMRSIETNRQLGTNAAKRDSLLAGGQQKAQIASQLLSGTLGQQSVAQGAYSQGASMLANKQFNQQNVPSGYQSYQQALPAQVNAPPAAWQPPTQTNAVAASAPAATGTGPQVAPAPQSQPTPQVPYTTRGPVSPWVAQGAQRSVYSYMPTGGMAQAAKPQGTISAASEEAQKRLQQYQTKTGAWAPGN